jgi:hypothetical protein
MNYKASEDMKSTVWTTNTGTYPRDPTPDVNYPVFIMFYNVDDFATFPSYMKPSGNNYP